MAVRWLLNVLNLLAVALPLWGAWSAYRKVRDRYRASTDLWQRLQAEMTRPSDVGPDLTTRLRAIQEPSSNYNHVMYLRELIAHLIVGDNFRGLRRDVGLIVAGLVIGFLANVWGVWIDHS